MSKKKTQFESGEILQAMEIYLTEYIHRDTHMWSQTYKLFFASLTIILLPYLTTRLGIKIPDLLISHSYIFQILGIFISTVFLYVSLGLAKRFKASADSYSKLIEKLPEHLKRTSIDDMPIKVLNHSHAYLVPVIMYIILIALAIFILISEHCSI